MAILRLRHTDKRPADGQAVQLVNIDGLSGGGGSSISSAEATTLEAGAEATAEIDGGVLKLGIPKGDTGETGPQGPQGAAGAAGAAGADGAGVAKITLTVADGAVTGGTWEDTDGESHAIEIESS